MDTSEKYVKMCEKTAEIQESHSFLKAGGILGIHINGEGNFYFGMATAYNAMENIWLPTQDRLQEMVEKRTNIWHSLMDLKDWCEDPYGYGTMPFPQQAGDLNKWADYIETFTSFEQLWLAFVMHEKYSKQWNGEKEEWIKEK